MAYNKEHGIVPKTVSRPVQGSLVKRENKLGNIAKKSKSEVDRIIDELQQEMLEAADICDFERAALLRDQIKHIRANIKNSFVA